MGKRFWLEHGGWLALVILLPAIPFLIVYSTYPSMPASEGKAFSADANRLRSYDRQPTEINLLISKDPTPVMVPMDLGNENDLAGGEAIIAEFVGDMSMESGYGQQNILPQNLTLAEERELQFEFIERQLHSVGKNTPVSAYAAGQRLIGEAMLVRARMQDDGTSEELLKRYQRSIRSIIRIIEGTRVTPHLDAQQIADGYEAWLVKELQSQGASDFFGTELRRAAETQLGDKAGRQNARYRALVVDWAASQSSTKANAKKKSNSSSPPDHSIGKYTIPTNGNGTRLISKRHVSTVAWRMKQYLMANDSVAMNQAKEALAREWNVPTSELSSTPTTFSTSARSTFNAPWSFWFGDWEKQADTYAPSNPSAAGR